MKQFNPPHPGEILQGDYLSPLGLSITEAAEALGIGRNNLSQIINGKSGISPSMALKLSRAFSTTAELWMNLQSNYDLWEAEKELKGLKKIPILA